MGPGSDVLGDARRENYTQGIDQYFNRIEIVC